MASFNYTEDTMNQNDQSDMIYDINVKIEPNKPLPENNIIVQIKPENLNSDDLTNENSMDNNPFENVRLEIKKEIDTISDYLKSEDIDNSDAQDVTSELESTQEAIEKDLEVKEENILEESLVSYDYPNFDDNGSMDSNDATALGNVEACLQDDTSFKRELMEDGILEENQKLELDKVEVKDEIELTVTDTQLISNKVNVTSTVTSPQDGLVEMKASSPVIMNVHTVLHTDLPEYDKDEEILPTTYSPNNDIHYEDVFQLNSITGNELSLEQEAYGLLEESKVKSQKEVEERQYICPKCPKVYRHKQQLTKHIAVHASIDKRAMGFIKGKQTRIENRMKMLMELEPEDYEPEDTQVTIPVVTRRDIRIDNRNKRRKALEGMNYKDIKKMKKKFKDDSDEQYSIHLEDLIPESEIKSEYELKVVKQENTRREGYQCTCGKIFQRKSRLETCLRSHNLLPDTDSCISCQSCTKQFSNKNELALHRRRIHRKRFPCKFCPTDYNTRKELFKHLQIHQKVQLMEYKVITEVIKGTEELRCFMCEKTCSELSELKSHVMEDHKEPYTCPHCQGTFPKIIDFANHTKTLHPEVEGQSVLDVLEAFSKLVKAWKCEECELQFHEADKLALHQVEKHSSELNTDYQFQCTDCRRVFVSQKGLTSHKRIHHNDSIEETEMEEKGLMCIECRKICKDEEALTSHMRFHSPERKYPCRYCDFRFATPEKRKAHAEIHTGDMKFVCFICEYQCSSENRLNQHKMSLKHLNMRELLRTGVPLFPEESTSKKEKSKDFKKKRSDKKKDDEQNGSSADGSVCDICGDRFSSESEMLEHKQTHPFIEFPNEDTPTRIFFK